MYFTQNKTQARKYALLKNVLLLKQKQRCFYNDALNRSEQMNQFIGNSIEPKGVLSIGSSDNGNRPGHNGRKSIRTFLWHLFCRCFSGCLLWGVWRWFGLWRRLCWRLLHELVQCHLLQLISTCKMHIIITWTVSSLLTAEVALNTLHQILRN